MQKGLLEPGSAALVHRKTALQVRLVDVGRYRTRRNRRASLRAGNRALNMTRNALGHVALQRQHVLQFAIIRTRPQVLVRVGPNQLNSDTNLVSRSQHRSFDNRVDV